MKFLILTLNLWYILFNAGYILKNDLPSNVRIALLLNLIEGILLLLFSSFWKVLSKYFENWLIPIYILQKCIQLSLNNFASNRICRLFNKQRISCFRVCLDCRTISKKPKNVLPSTNNVLNLTNVSKYFTINRSSTSGGELADFLALWTDK